jgi:FkbM family methyltransferase
VIQTQRAAQLLTPAPRLIARQATGGTGCYTVRQTGTRVHIRHRTRDLDILGEIFSAGSYEPPHELDLTGPLRVLDVGGNIGLFGAFALSRWDVSSLRSFEPDPGNFRLLEATARPHEAWETVEAALSNKPGEMRFAAGLFSESRAALPGENAITVRVEDIYAQPAADLVKVDIEGGEWPILTDPRLKTLAARAVVMEWHQNACPHPDAPALASRLLRDAGYGNQSHDASRFESNGMVWAWR